MLIVIEADRTNKKKLNKLKNKKIKMLISLTDKLQQNYRLQCTWGLPDLK